MFSKELNSKNGSREAELQVSIHFTYLLFSLQPIFLFFLWEVREDSLTGKRIKYMNVLMAQLHTWENSVPNSFPQGSKEEKSGFV